MACPRCGIIASPGARYCTACGTALVGSGPAIPPAAAAEEVLLRFGPFGVSITEGRPGLWKWSKRNLIEVVLTSQRLYGMVNPPLAGLFSSKDRGQVSFTIPLPSILAWEPVSFLANRCIWIRYREGAAIKEVSVQAAMGLHGQIDILQERFLRLVGSPGKDRS